MKVSAFTDTYLPSINGASYTVNLWKDKWNQEWGEMMVVYPGDKDYIPSSNEFPVRSLPLPFYDDINLGLPFPSAVSGLFRLTSNKKSYRDPRAAAYGTVGAAMMAGLLLGYGGYRSASRLSPKSLFKTEKALGPTLKTNGVYKEKKEKYTIDRDQDRFLLPRKVREADIVHVHGPFTMGIAGASLALSRNTPFVVSYHTPTEEYIDYLTDRKKVKQNLLRINNWWEKKYLDNADAVIIPSKQARSWIPDTVPPRKIHPLPNGVDIDFFRPIKPQKYKQYLELDKNIDLTGKTIGYCGRHGHEKRLKDAIYTAKHLPDIDFILVGNGPAHKDLKKYAEKNQVDNVYFPGFLEREKLPGFYSSLDCFIFPSDVETEGIVALESTACGTPVVAADSGGLKETVKQGKNGYRYPVGNTEKIIETIQKTLDNKQKLTKNCIEMREQLAVETTIEKLHNIYSKLLRK